MKPLNILLLCNKPLDANANTIFDHIGAFESYSKHKIMTFSNLGDLPLSLELNQFDVIIVHYTLSLLWDHFISRESKSRLRYFNGLKVLFVQDEYRQINKMVSEIQYLKFDVLFTCFPESEMELIYSKSKLPNLSLYNNLTGYCPENLVALQSLKKIKDRPIDVGYRGRTIPFWIGELAYEKYSIAEKWNYFTQNADLKSDISCLEEDRIYGKKWINYLSSCKTTLGVESGASVMDFTGKLETIVNFHQKTWPDDSFTEVQDMYFTQHEGKHKLNQISPRCFEAIALKTVLILYEGEYSNILIPDRHYIKLKKDFSNIEHVLSCIKDTDYLQNMADTAYNEITLNPEYTYKSFINKVDSIIENEFASRIKPEKTNSNVEKLNILLLCNKPKTGNDANTIVDHIEAIQYYSTHNIWLYSNLGDFHDKLSLNKFDVIIIHYSVSLLYNHFISDKAKERLRAYEGLKVAFVQDEYRQINKMISQLQFLKVDVL